MRIVEILELGRRIYVGELREEGSERLVLKDALGFCPMGDAPPIIPEHSIYNLSRSVDIIKPSKSMKYEIVIRDFDENLYKSWLKEVTEGLCIRI